LRFYFTHNVSILLIHFLQDEGWEVEFEIGHDDNGKAKAVSVTAPGGGPCFGPRKARPNTRRRDGKDNRTKKTAKGTAKPTEPFWHDSLTDSVKGLLEEKEIRKTTGTIDVSVGDARVKLGTNGYSSTAHASGLLAEGSFTCDADGNVAFNWEHWIACDKASGVWAATEDKSGLPSAFNLGDGECFNCLFFTNANTMQNDLALDPHISWVPRFGVTSLSGLISGCPPRGS
jgi:hypothetical protein